MVATTTGIKVGSAFIEINPHMDVDTLARQLALFEEKVKTAYKRNSDVTKAYARLQVSLEDWVTQNYGKKLKDRLALTAESIKARKALSQTESEFLLKALTVVEDAAIRAEKAKTAAKSAAERQKARIALNARDLEVKYGQQVADEYLLKIQQMQAGKKKLTLVQINETKRWAELEVSEIKRVEAESRRLQQQIINSARVEATERTASAKKSAAAYKTMFDQVKVAKLEDMRLDQMRERARLDGEIAIRTSIQETAAAQLASTRATLTQITAAHISATTAIAGQWKRMGEKIAAYGATTSELGRGLMTGIVTPMAAATTAITVFGVKSADSMQQAQTALLNMGVTATDTAKLINDLKVFGLKTPYSVEDMFKYGTQYTRAALSHDKRSESKNPNQRAKASAAASTKAEEMVMAVGNLAAYGGVTDPAQVTRAMYALSIMQDAGRASLRNVKQIADNAGIPVEALAQSFGFKDQKFTKAQIADKLKQQKKMGVKIALPKQYTASAQMMDWMAASKDTGGIPGEALAEALIKKSKEIGSGTANAPALKMGSATVGARISNMSEQARYGLASIFQSQNKKTGRLEYTGVGSAIMGTPTYDKKGNVTSYKGGLLNKVSDIGTALKGPAGEMVKTFFDSISKLADWALKFSQWLAKHDEVRKTFLQFAKVAAVVAPLALGLGAFMKIVGKLVKLSTPVVKGLGLLGKGLLGSGKIVGQLGAGALSAIKGNGFSNGYKNARTSMNGGDTRNLGQRTLDRARGRNSQEDTLRLNITQYEEAMKKAKKDADEFKAKIRELNSANALERLAHAYAGNDSSVQAAALKAEKASQKAQKATQKLNEEKLKALRGQYSSTTTGANNLQTAAKHATSQTGTLNSKSLKDIRHWFNEVKGAAGEALKKVSELTSKIKSLNGHKLDAVTKEVKQLGHELDQAGIHALALDLSLASIEKKGGGGSSSGSGSSSTKKSKKKKKGLAHGGVLPGYAPGVDNIPAILSPGESVLRPEVTQHLGEERINSWNAMAVRGKLSRRFASGGVAKKLGLDKLIDFTKFRNVTPDVLSSFATMTMDSSARPLGGGLQDGVVGTGTGASHLVGSDLATKFHGMYDFMTKDSWKALKKIPVPDGVTQAIGVLGGMLSPIAGQYFWDDVWKGDGNILQRGGNYVSDMFSFKTLKDMVGNLLGGAWDSVKSIWNTGKALLNDPVGTVEGAVSGLWDVVSGQYGGVIDMVKGLGDIVSSPLDYAGQVVSDTYSTAKDALPNTKGLFDFSGKKLNATKPDVASLVNGQMSKPAAGGSSVSRWTPQVKMALAQLGLPASDLSLVLHRIGVESGGNPKAINKWDINAKNGHPSQGLMQTIPSTFAAYAGKYKSRGITDPMASIYAGLNYAVHRYGSGWTKALSGTKGYATGTPGASRGWAWVGERGPELVKFGGGETVLNHQDSILSAVKALRGYASGTGDKPKSGVAVDAEKGVSSLNSAVKKLYSIITKAFTSGRIGSGTENGLNKWLDKENKKLTGLVTQRATIATKLKAANKALAKVKTDESNMATSISDTAKGQRSLTTIFNTDGVSVSSAISGLKSRLANIKKFQANISTLVKRGFSKDIIAEIAQAGPEQGAAMATELLNATKSQVADMNKTYAAIGKSSDSLGKSVAGSYYASGKKAAQSLVDGLTSKDKKLTKKIESMADDIVKTLKKKLHFNSKTGVNSGLATLLTWLTGESQSVSYSKKQKKGKTTTVSTSYSTNSKGQQVTTVTTTTRDPAKGTTTTVTERTVNGKTTTTKRTTKTKGYATGTLSASPGLAMVGERGPELVNFGGGERVYNARKTADMMGPRYEIHIHEAKAENTTQAVLRAMKYAEVMAAM